MIKTMKKILFPIIIIIILMAFIYSYFILGNQLRTNRGIEKGRDYVTKMYNDFSIAGENCQGEDSDNNGYITCNFRLKSTADQNERTITLQCPTFVKSFLATSCKEQGVVINQN